MKVVLLALSGEASIARDMLRERYPQAEIEQITRREIEASSPLQRLYALRARRPDVFAVSTERLAWQRGQNAFLMFGALAGARRSILLDVHGAWHEEMRTHILLSAPARLAQEAILSGVVLARARKRLRQIERAVERGTWQSGQLKKTDARLDAPKIVYLRATPGAGTQAGGAASHINGFINAALKLGADVSVVSNDRIAGLDETALQLKIIEPEPLGATRAAFDLHNNFVFTRGAVTEIERDLPDFIYQRYSRFNWTGVEASLKTGRPLFLEYNGSEVWVGKYWDRVDMLDLLKRFEQLNLAAATRIFVVSDVERRNLERAGVALDKIVVNPNGVDAEKFRPSVGGALMREKLSIAEDETLVGFVGTFGPWHGVLTLGEAITLIPREARIRFLLVGGGVLRDETERIIREAGAEKRVIFTGAVKHDEVPALLDACDVLASPHVPLADGSEFFGSPTKLFEYMAMGKAIVASRLGQIAEVLTDEETALLVEPGDAHALSQAIMRLANSRDLRERLGAAARNAALTRHTWTHNAERVLEAYRSLDQQTR